VPVPGRVGRELLLRQENQPRPIRNIAWRGQVRLCALTRAAKPAKFSQTAGGSVIRFTRSTANSPLLCRAPWNCHPWPTRGDVTSNPLQVSIFSLGLLGE
jgi:hypothetical protein